VLTHITAVCTLWHNRTFNTRSKGATSVIITVACRGMDVATHSSLTTSFLCFFVQRGVITGSSNLPLLGASLAKQLQILQAVKADVFISGSKYEPLEAELLRNNIQVAKTMQTCPIKCAQEWITHSEPHSA
jgi:hypothetical protein